MITMQEARQILDAALAERGKRIDGGLIVVEQYTQTKPYGWIFFYDGRRYIETRDLMDAIAGNGPIVILAVSGEAVSLGTGQDTDLAIAEFEKARNLMSG